MRSLIASSPLDLFEDFFNTSSLPSLRRSIGLDIHEDDAGTHISAELPGMTKDDIKISVDGNNLTISGEKKAHWENNSDKVHRVENYYGSFERTVALPSSVDPSEIDASYKDGILKISLPKREVEKNHKIEIH